MNIALNNKRKYKSILLVVALAVALVFSIFIYKDSTYEVQSSSAKNSQTDVDRAEHLFDSQGIPFLKIKGITKNQRHPAMVALYALSYDGVDIYDEKFVNIKNENKFHACIDWLSNNLKQNKAGLWVWEYDFDSTYNDITIKAPWSSAFAQATGIQALLVAYRQSGNKKYLDLAKKASKALFVPLAQGGFLFQKDNDIWFEEIPTPINNPSHILNGHMRVLLALNELVAVTHDPEIKSYLKQGVDTLYRWLPLYDTGYWLRYDLNPKKSELLFRFVNPYGFDNFPLAVNKIAFRDPLSKKEVIVNVGEKGDAIGDNRFAGTHWGQPEQVAGRTARRLIPSALDIQLDQLTAPHSYFYLSLPSEWNDNLRKEWFELVIDYYDEAPTNIIIQQRSIAPGQTFKDIRDGDLHFTGSRKWRQWIIPIRPSNLGYWVGESYADKHARYLKELAKHDVRFIEWEKIANAYHNEVSQKENSYQEINHVALPELPKQLPMLPIYSLDDKGVLTQNQATEKSVFHHNGLYDPRSDPGIQRYSPFVIAEQIIEGAKIQGGSYSKINKNTIKRENGLAWFLNSKNQKIINNSISYTFDFSNTYNDVMTEAPWSSAFSQAYILKALQYAAENKMNSIDNIHNLIKGVANSFKVPASKGGVSTISHDGYLFYEEVPNSTHVLNAHLISINELASTARYLNSTAINKLSQLGITTLREKLSQFDTGYWLRYDLNPKKELLFQIDWLAGNASPLIEKIELANPATETKSSIAVGTAAATKGQSRISGIEWLSEKTIDGKKVRSFQNGYAKRNEAVSGGTNHNVFFVSMLPSHSFSDYFSVPVHQLLIRYKDVSAGSFVVKIQGINEGNFLTFVPLRAGVINTLGDQQWKTARIAVRPQDLGWYVGPDYQKYEVEQIQRIANLTNDWFFYQYAQKHQDFLKAQNDKRMVVLSGFHHTDTQKCEEQDKCAA